MRVTRIKSLSSSWIRLYTYVRLCGWRRHAKWCGKPIRSLANKVLCMCHTHVNLARKAKPTYARRASLRCWLFLVEKYLCNYKIIIDTLHKRRNVKQGLTPATKQAVSKYCPIVHSTFFVFASKFRTTPKCTFHPSLHWQQLKKSRFSGF